MISVACTGLSGRISAGFHTFSHSLFTTISGSCTTNRGIKRKSIADGRQTTCIESCSVNALSLFTATIRSATVFTSTAATASKKNHVFFGVFGSLIVLCLFVIPVIVWSLTCLVHCPVVDSDIGSATTTTKYMVFVGLAFFFIGIPSAVPINLTAAATECPLG